MDQENLKRLEELNIEELCLNGKFGELKFDQSIKPLEIMRANLVELEQFSFRDRLSSSEIREIQQAMERFWELVNSILNFSIAQEHPQNAKNTIQSTIEHFYDRDFINLTRRSLMYLKQEAMLTSPSNQKMVDTTKQYEELVRRLDEMAQKVELNKQSVERNEGIVGSKYLSQIFRKQAKEYERDHSHYPKLIGGSIVTMTILVFVIGILYLCLKDESNNTLRIELGVLGAILIAVNYYVLRLFIRNSNSIKHLKETNTHRANVAETMESFLGASDDAETKEVLLKEAAQAMFRMETTGYLNKDQMEVNTPISEMVTNFIKEK